METKEKPKEVYKKLDRKKSLPQSLDLAEQLNKKFNGDLKND